MATTSPRNIAGFVLLLLSVGLLIPGLMNDLLTLEASNKVVPIFGAFMGSEPVFSDTRSILGTIGKLTEDGNGFVAFLILLFSVLVPFAKALIMGFVALSPSHIAASRMHRFVGIISKWSMADVFVVGIFIAFLSINTNDKFYAYLHSGFYFFTAYCITSILAVQLIKVPAGPSREVTN